MVKETTSLFILVVGLLVGNDVVGCRVGLCVGDAVIGGRVLDKVGNSVVVIEMGSSDGLVVGGSVVIVAMMPSSSSLQGINCSPKWFHFFSPPTYNG
jgi:phosphate/sulfate permease